MINKQKAIEEIAMDMFIRHHFKTIQKARECATTLFDLHYGNIPQALTEFAEKLKGAIDADVCQSFFGLPFGDIIDKELKEFLK